MMCKFIRLCDKLKHMKNELSSYYIETKSLLEKSPSGSSLKQLRKLHAQRVAEFQHERLIHLLVTMFFGLLTVTTYVVLVLVFASTDLAKLWPLLVALALILTVTEVFYVLHYYRLENGTQKLYDLTKALYKRE